MTVSLHHIVIDAHDLSAQARFWARVELLPWDPRYEIDERRLVRPEDFLRTLSWGAAPSAAIIFAAGRKIETER